MPTDDAELWWVVSELVEFTPAADCLAPVEVKALPGLLGYFAVFSDFDQAAAFASDPRRIQCLRVTRKQEAT